MGYPMRVESSLGDEFIHPHTRYGGWGTQCTRTAAWMTLAGPLSTRTYFEGLGFGVWSSVCMGENLEFG